MIKWITIEKDGNEFHGITNESVETITVADLKIHIEGLKKALVLAESVLKEMEKNA